MGQIMTFQKIHLGRGNRMLRVGFGQHYNRWFARIDLWCAGYRVTL